MILPTKHLPAARSLLGVGARLLGELRRPRTVAALWDTVREVPEVATFERFVLALDLLFLMGAVELDGGLVTRCARSATATVGTSGVTLAPRDDDSEARA